jgi:hypothetical protein
MTKSLSFLWLKGAVSPASRERLTQAEVYRTKTLPPFITFSHSPALIHTCRDHTGPVNPSQTPLLVQTFKRDTTNLTPAEQPYPIRLFNQQGRYSNIQPAIP